MKALERSSLGGKMPMSLDSSPVSGTQGTNSVAGENVAERSVAPPSTAREGRLGRVYLANGVSAGSRQ